MKKITKQRISILNMLSHISNVINSCQTFEQLNNTYNWGDTILKNHICFKIDDHPSWDADKMYRNYKHYEKLIEIMFENKLKKLENMTQKSNLTQNESIEPKEIVSLDKAKRT